MTKKIEKKEEELNVTQILERNKITHKNVTIYYEVDYRMERISIINPDGQGKQFLFKHRELCYMQGWKDILEAVAVAVTEAETKLKAYKDKNMDRIEKLAANGFMLF